MSTFGYCCVRLRIVSRLLNLIFSLMLVSHAYGQEDNGGKVHGNVTWKYNEYVGTKADVGAKVCIFRRFDPPMYLDLRKLSLRKTQKDKGMYCTQVNMLGQYELGGLPPGNYDLLIVSQATNRKMDIKWKPSVDYDKKYRETQKIFDQIEYLNFATLNRFILLPHVAESDHESAVVLLETAQKKYEVRSFELDSGENKEVNKDFGNTYY